MECPRGDLNSCPDPSIKMRPDALSCAFSVPSDTPMDANSHPDTPSFTVGSITRVSRAPADTEGDFGGDHPVRGERAVPTSYANHDMVRRGTRCGPHTPAGAADRSSLGRVPTDRQRRRRKSTAPAVDTDIILRIRPMSLLPHFSQSVLGGRSSVALSCRYITSACPKRHFTRMSEPEVDAHGPGAWSPTRATVRRPSRPQAGASCMTACRPLTRAFMRLGSPTTVVGEGWLSPCCTTLIAVRRRLHVEAASVHAVSVGWTATVDCAAGSESRRTLVRQSVRWAQPRW